MEEKSSPWLVTDVIKTASGSPGGSAFRPCEGIPAHFSMSDQRMKGRKDKARANRWMFTDQSRNTQYSMPNCFYHLLHVITFLNKNDSPNSSLHRDITIPI